MIAIFLALSAMSNRLGSGYKYNKEEDIANFENSSLLTRRNSSSVLPSPKYKWLCLLTTIAYRQKETFFRVRVQGWENVECGWVI